MIEVLHTSSPAALRNSQSNQIGNDEKNFQHLLLLSEKWIFSLLLLPKQPFMGELTSPWMIQVLCAALWPSCKECHQEAQPPALRILCSWPNLVRRSVTVGGETSAANLWLTFQLSDLHCCFQIPPSKGKSHPIKQKEVNNTVEYLGFNSHCFSVWCPNADDHFLSQSGIHSFPSPQMYSFCRPLRLIVSKPFEYLYHQGQCYISNCTFLLVRNPAEGCAKPYAFICRWHFYFHWMMRCPLFLITFPLKWQM